MTAENPVRPEYNVSSEPQAHPHLYDHYEIERVLGRGAMGVVYLARDLRIGRRVALKTLQEKHQNFDTAEAANDFLERFRREAELCGSLIHPNIITLYDVGYDRSRITYLAMEYVDGESLLSLLRRHGKLDLETALKVTDDVLQALAYAHDRGVIHRDIKPANVLVTVEGQAKVADFGVARSVRASLALRTQEGQILGTPYYMAPEHVAGRSVDARADLFSLGVVLFEMLSGHKPFDGLDVMETLYNVVNQPTPNLCAISGDIPRWAATFVERLLEKTPENRFLSASAASRELRRLLITHRAVVEEIDMTVSVPVLRATAPEETPTTPLSSPPSPHLSRPVPLFAAIALITAAVAALLFSVVGITRQINAVPSVSISQTKLSEFEQKRVMLREAQILYNAGAYEASLNHFDRYLERYPWSISAWQGRNQARQALEAIRMQSVPAVAKIEVLEERPVRKRPRKRVQPKIDPAADQVATASIVEEAFDRAEAEPSTVWERIRSFFRRTFRREAAPPDAATEPAPDAAVGR